MKLLHSFTVATATSYLFVAAEAFNIFQPATLDVTQNYATTKVASTKTVTIACITGDPHVDSFDGLRW